MTSKSHDHDLSISLAVNEVPLHLMATVRAELEAKMQGIVDEWMKDNFVSDFEAAQVIKAGLRPHISTISDGRFDCDCAKMGRRVGCATSTR